MQWDGMASSNTSGCERGVILRAKRIDAQEADLPGSELLGQRRSLESQSTRRNRALSRLFSSVPRRVFETGSVAGGEDDDYVASNEGGRRFDSCQGNYARVAQCIERLLPGQ